MKSRMPTRPCIGEGNTNGEAIDKRTRSIRRGSGTARREDDPMQRESRRGEGSGLDADFGRRPRLREGRRKSDRAIVPRKPGNTGGGKDPDFWNAFEDGEDRVIGDEPGNTAKDQDSSEEALLQG